MFRKYSLKYSPQYAKQHHRSDHIQRGMLFGEHSGENDRRSEKSADPDACLWKPVSLKLQRILQSQGHIRVHAWEYRFRRIHRLYKLHQPAAERRRIIGNALPEIKARRPQISDQQENVHTHGQDQKRFRIVFPIQVPDRQHRADNDIREPAQIRENKRRHMRDYIIQPAVNNRHLLRRKNLLVHEQRHINRKPDRQQNQMLLSDKFFHFYSPISL